MSMSREQAVGLSDADRKAAAEAEARYWRDMKNSQQKGGAIPTKVPAPREIGQVDQIAGALAGHNIDLSNLIEGFEKVADRLLGPVPSSMSREPDGDFNTDTALGRAVCEAACIAHKLRLLNEVFMRLDRL